MTPIIKGAKKTWDLTPLFKSDNDSNIKSEEKKIKAETLKFVKKWQSRDDYLKKSKVLKEALDDYEHWQRVVNTDGKIGHYFYLRQSLHENDAIIKAGMNKANDLGSKMANAIQFFELRIAKIPKTLQPQFLRDKSLGKYKHFLKKLFLAARYYLSEPEEKIIRLKRSTSYSNWAKLTQSLLAQKQHKVLLENGSTEIKNFSEISSLLSSPKKAVRDSAATAINNISANLVDVAEVEINSLLQHQKVEDELRKRKRPDLGRHLQDDIDSSTVDSLIQAVSDKYKVSHGYHQLLAKLLNQKTLGYHERNVEYGKTNKRYSFNQAINLLYKVFQSLDQKFADIFDNYLKNGQVDFYPKVGKQNGAFTAWGDLITVPTYVFLNHTDKLSDILTLAHEFGHAINSEFMRQEQNALNFNSPISVTEVASTFMEDFVLQQILKDADDELRLSLIVAKLRDDVGTIFRQCACYQFEKDLHLRFREKGYLGKDQIGQIFKKNMQAYSGNAIVMQKGTENWWVHWDHIRYFFYTYSYASGLLISKYLQARVKENPLYIQKVKEFLSAGAAYSPKEIFLRLDIDISKKEFWSQGLSETEKLLTQTELLAKKLGKI